jgi:hypothetical protein
MAVTVIGSDLPEERKRHKGESKSKVNLPVEVLQLMQCEP